jgi:AraC-like DNA-binding protein
MLNKSSLMIPQFRNCNHAIRAKPTKPRVHGFYEIISVTKGYCTIRAGDELFRGEPGVIALIPAGFAHALAPHGEASFYLMTFFNTGFLSGEKPGLIRVRDELWTRRWIKELYELRRAIAADEIQEMANGLLYALINRIQQLQRRQQTRGAMHPALARALASIERNVGRRLSVNALAREAMSSPSYLTALFSRHLNCSPMAYVRRLRLDQAARLLRDNTLAVAEIAWQCGFDDANAFSRQFKSQFNKSPREYRNALSVGEE